MQKRSLKFTILNGLYIPDIYEIKNDNTINQDIEIMEYLIDIDCNYIKYYKGINEKLYELALKKGFKPTINDVLANYRLATNKFIMQYLINKNPSNLKYYKGNKKEIFEIVNTYNELVNEETLKYGTYNFRSSCIIFRVAIKNNPNFIKYYQGTNEEIFKLAIDNGYNLRNEEINNLSSNLLKSKVMIKEFISLNPKNIEYYLGEEEDVFEYALSKGYKVKLDIIKKSNFLKSICILKELININCDNIKYYQGNDEDVFKYAFSKGHKINVELLKHNSYYSRSSYVLLKAIKINPNYLEYYTGNEEKVFNYAIDNGYEIASRKSNIITKYNFLLSERIIKELINIDCNNIRHYAGNNEKIYEYALSKGFCLTNTEIPYNLKNSKIILKHILNTKYQSNKFLHYFFNENVNNNLNYNDFELINNFIKNEQIFEVYSYEEIKMICKYFILTSQFISLHYINYQELFLDLIKKNKLIEIDKLIRKLNDDKFDLNYIKLLKIVLKSYDQYSELFEEVVKNKITLKQKNMILFLIDHKKNDEDMYLVPNKIKSLKELDNFILDFFIYLKLNISDIFNNCLNNNYLIKEFYSVITKLLCNVNYEEFCELGMDYSRLDKLKLNSIVYKKHLLYIEFVSSILKITDINELKKIIFNIIDYLKMDNNYIYEIIDNFKKNINNFYAKETQEKLIRFDELSTNDDCKLGYKKKPKQYYSKLFNKEVDFIELAGLPYIALAHVVNAYGKDCSIKDFKYPKLLGKSYICLSAIANDNIKTFGNNLTLLFSNFSIEQLVMESNDDVYSNSSENDLFIYNDENMNYYEISELIKNTECDYNELVFYREDSKGNLLYPSGILCRNTIPTEEEINAAAYLKVPLVCVNKEKYMTDFKLEPQKVKKLK